MPSEGYRAWEKDFWRTLMDEQQVWETPEPEHVSEYWNEDVLVGEIVDEPLELRDLET